jgi:glutamate-1-semialdehyde 2,1-aminomutase
MSGVGERLMAGLRAQAARHGAPLRVQGLGTVFNTTFSTGPEPTDYRSYAGTDLDRQRRFVSGLQDCGVRITSRGTWYLSTAHGEDELAETLAATDAALELLGKPD